MMPGTIASSSSPMSSAFLPEIPLASIRYTDIDAVATFASLSPTCTLDPLLLNLRFLAFASNSLQWLVLTTVLPPRCSSLILLPPNAHPPLTATQALLQPLLHCALTRPHAAALAPPTSRTNMSPTAIAPRPLQRQSPLTAAPLPTSPHLAAPAPLRPQPATTAIPCADRIPGPPKPALEPAAAIAGPRPALPALGSQGGPACRAAVWTLATTICTAPAPTAGPSLQATGMGKRLV